MSWPRIVISELCDLIVDCVNKTAPCVEYKTPFKMIRTTNIKRGRIDLSTCKFVSDETFAKWTKRASIEKGDVLLTREAPMGEVGKFDSNDNVFLGQRVVQYRVNKTKLNSDFLLYSLLSPDLQYQFRKHDSGGSTVSHIRVPDCSKFEIPLPSLVEQQNIAAVLSALDAKIDLNQRINAELEALAKTIYDYWFVQFDFSDANEKPYRSSGGKMVWNEALKREVPDGWDVVPLASLIERQVGGDWGEGEPGSTDTLEVVCIRGTDIDGLNGIETLNAPIRYISTKKTEKLLAAHDCIIEISGGSPTQSTGRIGAITQRVLERLSHPLVCSNFCRAIRLREPQRIYEFLQTWRTLYENDVFFDWEGKTSGIKNLQFDAFVSNYMVAVPPRALSQKFFEIHHSVDEKRQRGIEENQQLAQLHEWLLPLLMNGQVRVH